MTYIFGESGNNNLYNNIQNYQTGVIYPLDDIQVQEATVIPYDALPTS